MSEGPHLGLVEALMVLQPKEEDIIGGNVQLQLEPLETWQAILLAIPLCTLALWIVISNAFVILAVLGFESMRTPSNAYLASLASTDFLVGIIILPFAIIQILHNHWTLGQALCKTWLTLDVALSTLSILHLIAIAVDRYRVVSDGVSYIHKRSVKDVICIVLCLWCVSIWIAIPPVLGWGSWKVIHTDQNYICDYTSSLGYVLHSAFGSFIFPMSLMIFIYLKIYWKIQDKIRERAAIPTLESSCDRELSETEPSSATFLKSKKSKKEKKKKRGSCDELEDGGDMKPSNSRKRPSSQLQEFIAMKIRFSLSKERRAARTLGIIIGAFMVCWVPFCIMYILRPFTGDPPIYVYHTLTWLGYFNSAINPVVYCVYNNDFKKISKQIFCKWRKR